MAAAMNKLPIILILFSFAGCSHKVIYDTLRLDQRNSCIKEPSNTYIECINRTNKPYEAYERERKEVSETQK